jgi:serine/threonine protein kinase
MNSDKIGRGTYGVVYKVGNSAVKQFKYKSSLIQEYMACVYLSSCPYTVDVYGSSLKDRTMSMKLYSSNLRNWILGSRTIEQKLIAFREILKAITYLADLNLVHGDLKPDNILCNWKDNGNITKLVLGDLGFTALERFTKAQRTAPAYREQVVEKDHRHDIYSLGVIGLEMFGCYKVKKHHTSTELIELTTEKVKNDQLRECITKCFDDVRHQRPTSRWILANIYYIRPELQEQPIINSYVTSVDKNQQENLKTYFINTGQLSLNIRRCRLAYDTCIMAVTTLGIIPKHHKTYAIATLVIFSSIFGSSGFTVDIGAKEAGISEDRFDKVIEILMNDGDFINMIFTTHAVK